MPTFLTLVKGIGPATAEKLATAGLTTAEDLAATTPEQLGAVPGFGEFRAKQVIAHARQLASEGVPDLVERSDAKPSSSKKGVAKSKKGKPSKKSGAKNKDKKKKGKKGKLKKDKGKKTGAKNKDKKKK